jgi:uncharacterized LabA/DUF88 family protein
VKRIAFIDASNTNLTAKHVLRFEIDYGKLFYLLTNEKWNCEQIFYYQGWDGSSRKKKYLNSLNQIGYTVKTKYAHKFSDGNHKSNCDVELTVDVLENLYKNKNKELEFLIFTGDGDFEYLIKKAIEKGIKIKIISNRKRDSKNNRRFSSRLNNLIKKEKRERKRRIEFIDICDWKDKIKRASPK